jgi:hypothetical protein
MALRVNKTKHIYVKQNKVIEGSTEKENINQLKKNTLKI